MQITVVSANPRKGVFKSHPSESLDGAVQERILHLYWYAQHMSHTVQNAGDCFSGRLEKQTQHFMLLFFRDSRQNEGEA